MNEWSLDLKRYGGFRAFLREQSIYCILIYRFGRYVDTVKCFYLKRILNIIYYFLFRIVETIFATSIPKESQIGGGLRIWHFGQIFINSKVIIGVNCTLRHGVTIGNKSNDNKAPVIGDNVDIGANSMLIGDIVVGSNCVIGAMTLVNCDVPDNCTAVGIPARIIYRN